MTAETVHSDEKSTASMPMPAVAAHGLVEERPTASPAMAIQTNAVNSPEPAQLEPQPPQKPITGVAAWVVRHPKFTKEPFSYIAYQFARATFATIPYGFGMAAGHHAFQAMSAKGQKMGLTKEGIDVFNAKGLAAVTNVVDEAERKLLYSTEKNAVLGRNMMRLGNSPMNAAVQIALGFTMFRFVGGLVKNLRDRVMKEGNTPEQTADEVKHAGRTLWESAKINAPAEATATPIAALVLGFMNAAYVPTHLVPKRDISKPFLSQAKEVVFSKPAKLLQNAAVWTLSYSMFFLMAESLFKDKQIQRGKWKGHPNSLKNGPDDTVGGPGAVRFTPPEGREDKGGVQPGLMFASAEEGYRAEHKPDDDHALDSNQKLRYPWLTGEPSMGRFLIRRVAPVAVGITAYAALKRVGYLADVPLPGLKGVNGPMEAISVKKLEEMKHVGDHAKFFLKNAYREGKATIMFGALWAATDAWGTYYDKFVHNLQKPEHAVELTDHQQDKHAELLARLNAKELGAGRAA